MNDITTDKNTHQDNLFVQAPPDGDTPLPKVIEPNLPQYKAPPANVELDINKLSNPSNMEKDVVKKSTGDFPLDDSKSRINNLGPIPGSNTHFDIIRRHPIRFATGGLLLLIVGTWMVLGWFLMSGGGTSKVVIDGKRTDVPAQLSFGDDTLFVDSKTHSVGVDISKPNGLEVQSSVADASRGAANVRMGIDSGSAAVILESNGAKQWRMDNVDGVLRLSQPGVAVQAQLASDGFTLEHNLNVKGNTTLGSSAGSTTTIQGVNMSIPNSLNIGNNALYIGNNGQVGVGTNNPAGYKLFVAGNLKVTSGVEAASFNSGADSAARPSFTWIGNNNTGMFRAGANSVGISTGGSETLRVQPGLVASLNGANIEAEGYLRAGRAAGNPAWRLQRYTGSLDAGGSVTFGHGVDNGQQRILAVIAYYEGGSGESIPLGVGSIDGSNVNLYGGAHSARFRATIIYSSDTRPGGF